ncbi:MAG: type II toxin-antitoxin system VapC family toxin [Acidobacteriota bacterium]|nr:type II toxin-antitoxin system VapC family toxin [Acidobacteriota bacterium]
MIYVLDASAILAYLHGETGSDVVERAILDAASQCVAHSVNLCEVYYIVHRDSDRATADAAINDFQSLGVVERADFDQAFWKEAGGLKAGGGISLPDCFCITLTNRVGGTLLTSDHGEMDKIAAGGVCNITFIR